jgi:homoserine O-acetyltransferase
MKSILFLALLSLSVFVGLLSAQEQQTARIGDFKLESGEVIRDCTIGYRTFGTLSANKSNAVLFPTAFGWRSAGLATRIGAGKLVDSAKYYVIAVDSLGDGISSSPSNSKSQPGLSFPQFSIRDIVNVEQKAVSENMHIRHLHAVIGFSMGGIQAFQWAVSYPDFVDKIVSIVGSPQPASYDLLLWRSMLLALESDPDWKRGQYKQQPALHLMNMVQALALQTPEFVATHITRQDSSKFESELVQGPNDLDANDTLRQLQAMLSTDVASAFGGSLQRAAAVVHAQSLVIVNRQDHFVNPLPASEFANLLHAQLIELDSNCGHRVSGCEMQRIGQEVGAFLAK